MASFVKHEPCPSCGSRDNLGRYDDGSAWCFGCGYKEPRTGVVRPAIAEETRSNPKIPDDAGTYYSTTCVEWLSKYHVTVPEAVSRGLLWSPSRQQLIFQVGSVWQARNFSEGSKSRYFTSGDVNESRFIYGVSNSSSGSSVDLDSMGNKRSNQGLVVLVEDCVSALRIARQCDSIPLLGSHLATSRLNAVARLYDRLYVWLDSDKLKEARKIAERAKMIGMDSRVIYTPEDPKCYSDQHIGDFLNESSAK